MAGPCRPRYSLWPPSQCGSGEYRDALLPGWLVHAAPRYFLSLWPRHCAGQVSSGILYYLDGWPMPPSVFSSLWPSSLCGSGEFRESRLPGWLVHAALSIFCLSGSLRCADQVNLVMSYICTPVCAWDSVRLQCCLTSVWCQAAGPSISVLLAVQLLLHFKLAYLISRCLSLLFYTCYLLLLKASLYGGKGSPT
jgi:hypothetical protein